VRRIDIESPLKPNLSLAAVALIDANQAMLTCRIGEDLLKVRGAKLRSRFHSGQFLKGKVEPFHLAERLSKPQVRLGAIRIHVDREAEVGFGLTRTVHLEVDDAGS